MGAAMKDFISDEDMEKLAPKNGFISDADMDKLTSKPTSKTTGLESFARGAAQGALLGYPDELTGGFLALKDVATDDKVGLKDLFERYGKHRDESRKEYDEAAEANPVKSGAGNLFGGLATLAIPGLGIAKGASLAKVAAAGARSGAVSGFGSAEGDAKTQAMSTLAGGALGGATAGAIGKIGEKVGKGLASSTRAGAERAAYRATGGIKSDINKIYGNTPEQVGRNMLDEGVIPWFGKRGGQEIEESIRKRVGELSAKQDEFLSRLDTEQASGVPFEAIEAKMLREIQSARTGVGKANRGYADAIESELQILREKFKPSRATETVVGRPGETNYVPGASRDVVVTGPGAKVKEKVSLPDGMGGSREVEVDSVGPRKVQSLSRQSEGELERAPTRLSAVKGTQTAEPKTLSLMEALETKRDFDKGGKFQNRTEATSVEAARTARKAVKDALDDSIAASKAGPEAMQAYKADRNKSKMLLDGLRGLEQEGERQTARKQLFGLTDTIAGGGVLGGAMAAGLSTPATAALTLATVGGKKVVENYGDAFSARALDAARKVIEKYGFEEGIKRVSKVFGVTTANQIGLAIGNGTP